MKDITGYAGKRVVVTGCASGMGKATARLLLDLDAEVHGLDRQDSDLPLAAFHRIDLCDPASIENAAAALDGSFDALFNCAGLAPPFSVTDIMKVNFIGTRALTEALLPRLAQGAAIGSIASTAGMGWSRRIPVHKQLIATPTYQAALAWVAANPTEVAEGYSFSKEAVIVWTMQEAQKHVERRIRVNCIMPALTHTPMMTDQIAVNTSPEMMEQVVLPWGRPAKPEEQAFMLVMANAPAASFLNGAAINVDGGRMAKLVLGV